MEALGIRIDLTPDAVARCIDEAGIGFLFAPLLHEAMRYVVLARREMKIRTVFNLLGPICNPARATAQVLGVYNEDLTEIMAQVLCELGSDGPLSFTVPMDWMRSPSAGRARSPKCGMAKSAPTM